MSSDFGPARPEHRLTSEPLLAFHDVSKTYDTFAAGTKHALDRVSFEISPGERIAIVGRSGSGKSTLLHLAAGIDLPTSGTVRWKNTDLRSLTERRRTLIRRDDIGLVFQFFHLLSHLSVAENVALPELIAGGRLRTFRPRVMHLLERVGLDDRADDVVDRLSGGEMQRVAICRALLRQPTMLLADEPTGNLDDATGQAVMDLMLELAEETNSALVYVTHSHELATRADAVWTLHSGTLDLS